MKSKIVQELLGITRPTLLKRAKELNIPTTKAGDHVFTWQHVGELYRKYTLEPLMPHIFTKIISICQNKGGVAKTTTTMNLAYLFSLVGKTLLIDMDSQADLSQVFGVYDSKYYVQDILDDPSKTPDAIHKILDNDNLYLIPNNINFDNWKNNSNSKRNVQYFLQRALKDVKEDFDVILIDCPGSIDLPFEISMNTSNYALILLDGHDFSLKGMQNVLRKIDLIIDQDKEFHGVLDLAVLGLSFTKYKNTKEMNNIISQAQELASEKKLKVFNTKIRENSSVSTAQIAGLPVFLFDEVANGSIDYFKLWQELMEKIING